MIQLTLMNPQSRKEGKERGRAAKKSKKECGRDQQVLDFIMNKYLDLAGYSPPLCLGNSPCFLMVLFGETGLCAAARSPSCFYYTHSLSDLMFSLDMALKVCGRIRLRGERGSQVKEGVMFVSASAESNWSGTSGINTLTATQ